MNDNTISVSGLPDSFVEWVNEMRDAGKEQRAPFLRRYMLRIDDYVEWMRDNEEVDMH
ncbi:MAG: hypothetical protein ACXQTO_01190 [Candidatus Syntropharchaeales archaeon]